MRAGGALWRKGAGRLYKKPLALSRLLYGEDSGAEEYLRVKLVLKTQINYKGLNGSKMFFV